MSTTSVVCLLILQCCIQVDLLSRKYYNRNHKHWQRLNDRNVALRQVNYANVPWRPGALTNKPLTWKPQMPKRREPQPYIRPLTVVTDEKEKLNFFTDLNFGIQIDSYGVKILWKTSTTTTTTTTTTKPPQSGQRTRPKRFTTTARRTKPPIEVSEPTLEETEPTLEETTITSDESADENTSVEEEQNTTLEVTTDPPDKTNWDKSNIPKRFVLPIQCMVCYHRQGPTSEIPKRPRRSKIRPPCCLISDLIWLKGLKG